MIKKMHMSIYINYALENPKRFKGFIIDDNGRLLTSLCEVKNFLRYHHSMGHKVIPFCDCDNFDYRKGCLDHVIEENENANT